MQDPWNYARGWCAAWNARNLELLLSSVDELVVFSSPAVSKVLPASGGLIVGRAALLAYWVQGLRLIPNLHLEVLGVYAGIDRLIISYSTQTGRIGNEELVFRGSMVVEGRETYLVPPERACPFALTKRLGGKALQAVHV